MEQTHALNHHFIVSERFVTLLNKPCSSIEVNKGFLLLFCKIKIMLQSKKCVQMEADIQQNELFISFLGFFSLR